MSQPTNPDPDLMRIFDFTPADLEANRAGKLTERQSQHLLNYVSLFPSLLFGIAFIVAIIMIFRDAGALLFLVLPFELILYIVAIAVGINKRQIVKSDVEAGVVAHVSGSISRRSRRNGGDIFISDRTLKISQSENKALKKYLDDMASQAAFRVYYIPRSKKVLSIEVV